MALSVSRLNTLVNNAGDQSRCANKAADMLNGAYVVVIGLLAQVAITRMERDTGPVSTTNSAVGGDLVSEDVRRASTFAKALLRDFGILTVIAM